MHTSPCTPTRCSQVHRVFGLLDAGGADARPTVVVNCAGRTRSIDGPSREASEPEHFDSTALPRFEGLPRA